MSALTEDNFIRVEDEWLKVNLAVIETASNLVLKLTELGNSLASKYSFCLQIAGSLQAENLVKDPQRIVDVERSIWPAKIVDADIPSFIIPIKPMWAEALFDERLANQSCLENNLELALRCELVYYRSASPNVLKAPGRILWYVTKDKRSYCQEEVKSIRACSYLDEVVIGRPELLYKRFRRLGVYTYENIQKINVGRTNNSYQSNIMAIRFSKTELFKPAVNCKTLKDITGNKIQFQSPYKISNDLFKELYNRGMSS